MSMGINPPTTTGAVPVPDPAQPSIIIPCPQCGAPRDFSHLPAMLSDWQNTEQRGVLLALIAADRCRACRMRAILTALGNGDIHLCTRQDVLGGGARQEEGEEEEGRVGRMPRLPLRSTHARRGGRP